MTRCISVVSEENERDMIGHSRQRAVFVLYLPFDCAGSSVW